MAQEKKRLQGWHGGLGLYQTASHRPRKRVAWFGHSRRNTRATIQQPQPQAVMAPAMIAGSRMLPQYWQAKVMAS